MNCLELAQETGRRLLLILAGPVANLTMLSVADSIQLCDNWEGCGQETAVRDLK